MGEGNESAVEACERAIRRWILRGGLRPGERLVPERVLASRLAVNRTTLRSALTRLVRARLLKVRQGSGYQVRDYRESGGIELVPELGRAGELGVPRAAAGLLQLRRMLVSTALTALAASGRGTESVAAAVERFGERARGGTSAGGLAMADQDVLAAPFASAECPVAELALNDVSFAIRDLRPLRDALYADPDGHLAVAWMLARWAERPRAEAVEDLLGEVERRDAVVLERLEPSARVAVAD